MKGKRRILWLAAAVALLQSGVLFAMVEQRASALRSATDITLLTHPVDPRDLLRGEYVALGYDISAIPTSSIEGTAPKNGPADVFVTLRPDASGKWAFARASWQRPSESPDGEITLRGRIGALRDLTMFTTVPVTYGIERYYVAEGQGRVLEDLQRKQQIEAVVAVSPDGEAQVRALRDGDKVLDEQPSY
ncbi:GDYXXLXY domain-containing protein [Phyllobacterium sp. 21LDTY02-6]|uniref:GDYXXLXY domain-containing protein n=1 Tax=unclassified Phyllobacterium TaxID=2638441 RepID=UPI002022583E|nr:MULTISPECIES: GDYXXLXY domain-containing protein [unclassified Phyllobacterium]MCO4316754.1 GDYXXLXY domain-containing protein [Phyllobacterium sp. 21LDTY02-6]MCX8281674.1 GDYXXLXY domain-containing protein [Phyllobacterium sp. 0TCS1.6C]MCX8294784.1 GDYXXLXY domain-containing protein [Phyllobacterium sp. 0TCS1.6A]